MITFHNNITPKDPGGVAFRMMWSIQHFRNLLSQTLIKKKNKKKTKAKSLHLTRFCQKWETTHTAKQTETDSLYKREPRLVPESDQEYFGEDLWLGMGWVPFLPYNFLVWSMVKHWVMQIKTGQLFGFYHRSPRVGDLKSPTKLFHQQGAEEGK